MDFMLTFKVNLQAIVRITEKSNLENKIKVMIYYLYMPSYGKTKIIQKDNLDIKESMPKKEFFIKVGFLYSLKLLFFLNKI